MPTKDFISHCKPQNVEGQFTWKAPSNIALVKYWGKSDPQIPKNASLSFTLSQSYTETKLRFFPKENITKKDNFDFEVILDGAKKEDFRPKIQKFLENIAAYVPFLKNFRFEIHTHNSFPHSSGIASSASSFAALALCIMSMEKQFSPEITDDFFYQKSAFLARLGSGSATRSIKGNLVLWGKHPQFETSSDLFGVQFPQPIHPVFKNYQDTILLVDKGQKKVSSSVGHSLMNNHPFAEERFKQANENIVKLSQVLEKGDLDGFIAIVESEALSLHAMMMTANPYFILMQPNTLAIIQKIWNFRQERNLHVCFTLDAGANVHVLYPENEKEEVKSFIVNELVLLCQNNQYICDVVGDGAVFLSEKLNSDSYRKKN